MQHVLSWKCTTIDMEENEVKQVKRCAIRQKLMHVLMKIKLTNITMIIAYDQWEICFTFHFVFLVSLILLVHK